jgi:hypothetical protein
MTTATAVSYDDYLEAVLIASVQHTNWRVGQCAFNALTTMRPELAEFIRGTELDPFYADIRPHGHEKMALFLAHVREQWNPDEEDEWQAQQW